MLIVPRNHCPICSHQLPGTVNSSCQVMQVFELIYIYGYRSHVAHVLHEVVHVPMIT